MDFFTKTFWATFTLWATIYTSISAFCLDTRVNKRVPQLASIHCLFYSMYIYYKGAAVYDRNWQNADHHSSAWSGNDLALHMCHAITYIQWDPPWACATNHIVCLTLRRDFLYPYPPTPLLISWVLWHSRASNFTEVPELFCCIMSLKIMFLNITAATPAGANELKLISYRSAILL